MRLERGRCFCGAIQVEMTGEPFWVCYDHDDDCRCAIGGPLTIWIGYRSAQFKWTAGCARTFSKTRGVTRYFCGACGSSIAYTDEGLPGEIYITIGFTDAPERFPPSAQAYWQMRLPFVAMDDGLPRIDAYTRPRDPAFGNPRDR